jgi:hypothetical protein
MLVLTATEFFGLQFGKVKQDIDIPYLRKFLLREPEVGEPVG